jgi:hypothetical protein
MELEAKHSPETVVRKIPSDLPDLRKRTVLLLAAVLPENQYPQTAAGP